MLVTPRSVQDAVAAMSVVTDEAANEAWGRKLQVTAGLLALSVLRLLLHISTNIHIFTHQVNIREWP